MKNSSFLFFAQNGRVPPSVEISQCPSSTFGNGWTYTCHEPFSFDSYASQWSSGERWPFRSGDVPRITTSVFGGLPNVRRLMVDLGPLRGDSINITRVP